MRKLLFTLHLTFLFSVLLAQYPGYEPNFPPNEYRSKNNPFYWQNRKPFDGYWQQDVYYKIKASIDERTDIIDGEEWLTYWNNSPDTLSFVYFHLYQQAFVKGGHIEQLNLANKYKQTFGKYESQGLGEVVDYFKVNDQTLETEEDFSVVKVHLPELLLPHDSITFHIKFKTYFDNGSQRRRMKKFDSKGFTHYDGVHWYPRICVYDRKFGWDTNQHLGKEFYGDFGTYDVELTFSSNYVVGATGTLQNPDEVLPLDLRNKLDLSNFRSKLWESSPSIIIPYDSSQRKTWHYYAENVHDFAWTADPNYRIGESYATIFDPYLGSTRQVLCQSLAQESHAAGWQDAVAFTAKVIETYSHDFGMYSWPKIIVADARDGMEYPMLTLDGGFTPNYYDLLAHEVGHMWFFAQVGNNETYRAALDEGFTQFIESWAMKKIVGDTMPGNTPKSWYLKKFEERNLVLDEEVYLAYLQDAARGTDESINQHSDMFNSALGHGGGYRQVYFKTATMLWNLQYVMGDSLFQKAMSHYFNQWKLCHPYFEDFRNSIIQYSHVDLNWFFDEWMETTKTIDYKIDKVNHQGNDNYEITFSRKGRSQMPIDFEVEAKDGKTYNYYIPNTWFAKETPATVLPKWYGWDKLHNTYACTITIPSGIKQITIDPTFRLADVYMSDNYWKCEADWKFDSQVSNLANWKKYEINWRPDVWYNAVDGFKLGWHLDGGYFNLKNKFWLTAWYNSGLLNDGIFDYWLGEGLGKPNVPVSFNASYSTNTNRFLKNSSVDLSAKYLDGLMAASASFSVTINANNIIGSNIKFMERQAGDEEAYLLYNNLWNSGEWNNNMRLNYDHKYSYFKGTGDITLTLLSSAFSKYSYSHITLTSINHNHLGKLDWDTRFFFRGGNHLPPPESALYLSGGSPEEMMENKYLRSKGFVPDEWLGYGDDINHFQFSGGMNLRGYAGYLVPEYQGNDSVINYFYYGHSGIAFNTEIDFDKWIALHPKWFRSWLHFDTYLFGDAGTMIYNYNENLFLTSIRADAGLGIAMTIKSWGPLDKAKPLTIRADFPLFLNRTPAVSPDYLAFRWVIGVGRSF